MLNDHSIIYVELTLRLLNRVIIAKKGHKQGNSKPALTLGALDRDKQEHFLVLFGKVKLM